MGERSYETRIAEAETRLQKAIEKAEKEKARLKQLQAKKEDAERKKRTHMLIVCGAEIAALYGGQHLNKEEIHEVVDYLRRQKEKGAFSIRLDSAQKKLAAIFDKVESLPVENQNIDNTILEKLSLD